MFSTWDNDIAAACFSIDAGCNLICSVFEITSGSISINVKPSRGCRHTWGIKLLWVATLQFFEFAYSVFAMLHIQVDDHNILGQRASPQCSGPTLRPHRYCYWVSCGGLGPLNEWRLVTFTREDFPTTVGGS